MVPDHEMTNGFDGVCFANFVGYYMKLENCCFYLPRSFYIVLKETLRLMILIVPVVSSFSFTPLI